MNNGFIDEDKLKHYFNGNNPEDALYIEKIFTDDEAATPLKKILEKQFSELPPENETDKGNLDQLFYRIHYDITTREKTHKDKLRKWIKWTSRIAGALFILLVLCMGVYFHREYASAEKYWVEIKAPAWTRAQFSLPDGTTGWLNSNSGIKYKGSFANKRTVLLTGEAYFDVAKNTGKPFLVQTRDASISVLGTRFNIAAYENEKDLEVVLEEGKLAFKAHESDRTYTLKPNDLVVYHKDNKEFTVESVHSAKYTSWKEGKLIFRNDPIDVVTRRLERWYNIVIVNNVPVSEDIRWRATFEDENLERVLDIMEKTLPVDYTIEESNMNRDDIYVKKRITITLKNNP